MRAQLVGGGARPSLFQVQVQNPINPQGDLKMAFMCRAAQLPAETLSTIEVPYFGRSIKINGNRDFDPWEVTVINDEDFLVRNAMEEWMSAINQKQENITSVGASPANYKSQAEVIQYSKDGSILRKYKFSGLWPQQLGSIELDWDNSDAIQEFAVTFQYDWFTVSGGVTGDGGGA